MKVVKSVTMIAAIVGNKLRVVLVSNVSLCKQWALGSGRAAQRATNAGTIRPIIRSAYD